MSSARDPNINKTLGDYHIDRLIAKGGMGKVYEATDGQLDRKVAVKVITLEEEVADELMDRFQREARVIGQLDAHPNIVTIYRYGKEEGLHYIAMKYIQGQSLADYMRDLRTARKNIPIEEMLYILRQVAAALDYAHEKGVIHRDVKPANIMLEDDPMRPGHKRAVLMDFGLVLRVNNTMTAGSAFGTPRYISPEQAISSAQASRQSDIYSLGVVVYEMVAGKPPFDDEETPIAVALSHVTKPPPNPKGLRPEISDEVVAVLMKVLAKKPEDRYQTATYFIAALEKALLGRHQPNFSPAHKLIPTTESPTSPGITALERPSSLPQRQAQRTSREYLLPTMLLLLIFIGLGALAANLMLNQEDDSTDPNAGLIATDEQPVEVAPTEETEIAPIIQTQEPTSSPSDTPEVTAAPIETEVIEPPTHTPQPEPIQPLVAVASGEQNGVVEFAVFDGALVVRNPSSNTYSLWLANVELRQGEKVFSFEDFGSSLLHNWRPGICSYVATVNQDIIPSDRCSSDNPRTLRYVRSETFPWLDGTFEVYQDGQLLGTCESGETACQISGVKRTES